MAVHPLRPATDRRLGGPLPHQLANQTRGHLSAINLWHLDHAIKMHHAVLAVVSNCCPPLKGRFLTRYSPVRHCPLLHLDESSFHRFSFDLHVLSTPPAFVLSQDQTLHDRSFVWLDYFLPCSNSLLGIATSHISLIRSLYCSVFKEPSLFKRLYYLTTFEEVCQMIF